MLINEDFFDNTLDDDIENTIDDTDDIVMAKPECDYSLDVHYSIENQHIWKALPKDKQQQRFDNIIDFLQKVLNMYISDFSETSDANRTRISETIPVISIRFKFRNSASIRDLYGFSKTIAKFMLSEKQVVDIMFYNLQEPRKKARLILYGSDENEFLYTVICIFVFFRKSEEILSIVGKHIYKRYINSRTVDALDYALKHRELNNFQKGILFAPAVMDESRRTFTSNIQTDYIVMNPDNNDHYDYEINALKDEYKKDNRKKWKTEDALTVVSKAYNKEYYCWWYYKVFNYENEQLYETPGFILYYKLKKD